MPRTALSPQKPFATFRAFTILILAFLFLFGLTGCGDSNAGAVGTENAGRVAGAIVAPVGQSTEGYLVRLLSTANAGTRVVDSVRSDSSGAFRFPEEQPGNYWVQIWKNGVLRGESKAFLVNGDVSGILVILVEGIFQQSLDLSALGNVDSVFVDYPQNRGVKVGSLWQIQTTRDSAFVIHAHLGQPTGRWEEWVLVKRDGRDVFVNLADSRALDFQRKVDTGAFLLTSHTVALWDFDTTFDGGVVRDQSKHGNELILPKKALLVQSPHGKAFSQSTGQPAVVGGAGILAPSFRWKETGAMTYEMRIRLDSIPLGGMVVLGSEGGPRIWITRPGQIVVETQAVTESDTLIRSVVTEAGKVPLGRWIDLAVSLDAQKNQIYVWIDEEAQTVFCRQDWPNKVTLVESTAGEFCVGGATWDDRPTYFQVDEIRISDTLVYGSGFERLSSTESDLESENLAEGLWIGQKGPEDSSCSNCGIVRIGALASLDGRGYYAWKPALLKEWLGKTIVSASIVVWDSDSELVSETKNYQINEILESWKSNGTATDWLDETGDLRTSRVDPHPFSEAPHLEGSRGALIFDATAIVQKWIDDPSTSHGVLFQASDPTKMGEDFMAAGEFGPEARRLTLLVRYR